MNYANWGIGEWLLAIGGIFVLTPVVAACLLVIGIVVYGIWEGFWRPLLSGRLPWNEER